MSLFKTGLVVGKFYPPHKGHQYLIEFALKRVEKLTILVCWKPEQTIPGALRAKWLKKMYPRATVLMTPDDLPEDDSKLWAERTISVLGFSPEAVFTSENYGDPYSHYLKCTHVLVDKERKNVPIGGRYIRANPLKLLHFLDPIVRAYFVKRICVVGAESTGTTTLAKALAEHYHTLWNPEYGRMYAEGKIPAGGNSPWISDEFRLIASMQNKTEDYMAGLANKLLICDTNSFATLIWHQRYMNSPSLAVERLAKNRKYDLYIVTDVDIPFIQDGTRDGEHIRTWMHNKFIEELEKRKLPYIVVSDSHEKRMQKAVKEIDKIMKIL